MKHLRVYISLVLLSLFTAYQVSITMFTHAHYVNGVLITHSHPYSTKAEHTHTQAEVQVINRLSDYQTFEASTVFYTITTDIAYGFIEAQCPSAKAFDSLETAISLRAPPSLFLI